MNEKEQLWHQIERDSLAYQFNLNKLIRKQTGVYYTGLELASAIVEETFTTMSNNDIMKLPTFKFLEPCVGSGNFVFAYLKKIDELAIFSNKQIEELVFNIYVCEIDQSAVKLYLKNLEKFTEVYFGFSLKKNYRNNIGKGLVFNVLEDEMIYTPIEDVFPNIKFDIVITNPPYKNLRAELKHYRNENTHTTDRFRYKSIKSMISVDFPLSNEGTINLYKLFVEEILKRYTSDNAIINVLIPSSILTAKTSTKLRTYILSNTALYSIINVPEINPYIDAKQRLSALMIRKGSKTEQVYIRSTSNPDNKKTVKVNIEDIMCDYTGNSIIAMNKKDFGLIKQMNKHPRLKEIPYIHNMRGELDLTLYKNSITENPTKYKLLRGRHISRYHLQANINYEYVQEEFVINSSKQEFINSDRLVCQQVVNLKKEQRLSFVKVNSEIVLANSCNFIYVDKNLHKIDDYYILGLLNSKIMNWYFNQHSSNNHINNYELDSLPIPIDDGIKIKKISKLVKEYLNKGNSELLEEIDLMVLEAFGIMPLEKTVDFEIDIFQKNLFEKMHFIIDNITQADVNNLIKNILTIEALCIKYGLDDFQTKVIKGIFKKEMYRKNNYILNNSTFKMSELDMEMIRSIPQGGNWKDIPQETKDKSKRLLGIQKSGGRTTLYGRMDYKKSSYTITTYFNRPGNGTYIHPIHNRVITVREAARIQGFDDDFLIHGNQRQTLNQIGNAVPPQIGYLIGCNILKEIGPAKSIDLFCGAGGITSGLKKSGITSILGNDIEESACITFKINNPEVKVLCSDISKAETKEIINRLGKINDVDIISGGPPCQGFSMAGFRDIKDPRNQLFRDFVDVVSEIKPKVIIFENVQGILTLNNGEIYKELSLLFGDIGYNLSGKLLNFADYGVPQKRKRVILIGTRKDIKISPESLFPNIYTSEDEHVTVYDAISSLENIVQGENESYPNETVSNYEDLVKGIICEKEYYKQLQGRKNGLEQLELF